MSKALLAALRLIICTVSVPASAQQIFLEVDQPKANAVVGDTVNIALLTTGSISRIEANIGTHVATLSTQGGQLSLAGEPSGSKTLTVTAYDSSNTPTSKTVALILDRPPLVVITDPVFGQVVRPGTLAVQASCTDDGATPCTVTTPGSYVIGPENEGQIFSVEVTAVDSRGQSTTVSQPVFVESSPTLREVLTAEAGQVLDFDGTRGLVQAAGGTRLMVVSSNGQSTLVYDGSLSVARAQLYPQGALYVLTVPPAPGVVGPGESQAWRWENGVATRVGTDATVSGNWLAALRNAAPSAGSAQPTDPVSQYLVLRDLLTGTETVVTSDAPAPLKQFSDFLVAKNGDLLWQLPAEHALYIRRAGVSSQLDGGGRAFVNVGLDEYHATSMLTLPGQQNTTLYGSAGMESLCSASDTAGGCTPAVLSNGWVAYSVPAALDAHGDRRFFRRAPDGSVGEITGLDARATISAISPGGEVAAVTLTRRFIASPGGSPPRDVSSKLGRSIYLDRWYVLLGRSVFEVLPPGVTADSDAGVPVADAGSPTFDAGSADSGRDGIDASSPTQLVDGGVQSSDAALAHVQIDAASESTRGDAGAIDAGAPSATGPKSEDDSGCSVRAGHGDALTASLLFVFGIAPKRRRRRLRELC